MITLFSLPIILSLFHFYFEKLFPPYTAFSRNAVDAECTTRTGSLICIIRLFCLVFLYYFCNGSMPYRLRWLHVTFWHTLNIFILCGTVEPSIHHFTSCGNNTFAFLRRAIADDAAVIINKDNLHRYYFYYSPLPSVL